MPHSGESARAVHVMHGVCFSRSDAVGDIDAAAEHGLFFHDTRHLSRFTLTVDGQRTSLLTSHTPAPDWGLFHVVASDRAGKRRPISVTRSRRVEKGMVEEIVLQNHAGSPVDLVVALTCEADFASVFEVEEHRFSRSGRWQVAHRRRRRTVQLSYRKSSFCAATTITVPDECAVRRPGVIRRLADRLRRRPVTAVELRWRPTIPAHGSWSTAVPIHLDMHSDTFDAPEESAVARPPVAATDDPLGPVTVTSPWGPLAAIVTRSLHDLDALLFPVHAYGQDLFVPAGGLPWYMALFGRDSLLTSYLSIAFAPALAANALQALAHLQGRRRVDERDEEPGKILHELRLGRQAAIGDKPYHPYYGTIDATPLFLIVLSEHWRWTGDTDLCVRLKEHALAALSWIDRFGDRDGDGFVEYATRSRHGARNQGWKDSGDGVQFADGRLATPPIALCEAQGYVFDAKRRLAEVAEEVWDDTELATRLRSEATALFDRFNESFWTDRRGGYYVEALDARKRQVDSLASNMGHLLWSGIVPPDRAEAVVTHLLSDPLFSGWGVRTLATDEAGYDPVGYHLGTVWPHDNALIAAGMARYGFRDAAAKVAGAMLDAAARFDDNRLPETFTGFDRDDTLVPVWYPKAASPQAWSAATPLHLVRVLLGLDARHGLLECDPAVPERLAPLQVTGVRAGGTAHTVSGILQEEPPP